MPENITIRLLTTEDIPAVQTIAEVAWRSHYPGIISLEQIDYMLNWMYSTEQLGSDIQRGVKFIGLFSQGELSGFAAWELLDASIAYLHKLYLRPEAMGAGLGSQLISSVFLQAKAAGASMLKLAVNKENVKAIKAYERNGFVRLESVCNDIGNGFVMDDYVYSIALS